MPASPLVSILMPVKNSETFLADCLHSILNQTYTDWELLAVDDHSSDSSYQILKDFAANDKRVKVFKNKGSGIICALRLAFAKSKGQLITRMDSDDIMAERKLETLAALLMHYGTGTLATGLVKYFSNEELGNGYLRYQRWLNNLTREENNFSAIYKECVIPSPCWMVHRKDLERAGAFEPNIYPEDYDLCFRLYKAGLKIKSGKEILHHWRDHLHRTSRTDKKYRDQLFPKLTVSYFLELDRKHELPLFLWSAGTKAKKIARLLNENQEQFRWICDNPKKIGQDIYGTVIEPESAIYKAKKAQVIVAVSAPKDQKKIRSILEEKQKTTELLFHFFC